MDKLSLAKSSTPVVSATSESKSKSSKPFASKSFTPKLSSSLLSLLSFLSSSFKSSSSLLLSVFESSSRLSSKSLSIVLSKLSLPSFADVSVNLSSKKNSISELKLLSSINRIIYPALTITGVYCIDKLSSTDLIASIFSSDIINDAFLERSAKMILSDVNSNEKFA